MRKYGIGQAIRRVEDQRFITGQGSYIADLVMPRMLYGVVVFSPHAHADIRSINTAAASVAPGVRLILTGKDAEEEGLGGFGPLFMPEDMGGPKGFRTTRPVLARDRVRFVGDRVAFVVADSEAQARAASELIEVEYSPLPAIVEPEDAITSSAPKIWGDACPDNTAFTAVFGDQEKTDSAFETAAHVVSLRVENNRVTANAIEPRGSIGDCGPDNKMTLWSSNQNPHGVRTMLCTDIFNVPETSLRVITPDVGGGFGMKADAYPEDALVLWAARKLRRPVRWVATRSESLIGDTIGRGAVAQGEMALSEDGRILGMRIRAIQALGPYIVSAAASTVLYSVRFVTNVYDIPTVYFEARAVFTNTGTLGPYRGAGRPEAILVVERLLDKAAKKIGIGPDEMRRRNFIRQDAFPYETPTQFIYDTGEFETVLDKCKALADWNGFSARVARSAKEGLLRGRGMCCFIEQAAIFNERMELRFDASGHVTIVAGTHSHGQGHATTFAQMISEWLGVPFETIRYVQGDTDKVPFGRGTYAARSSMLGGAALREASNIIIEKCRGMSAFLMDTKAENVEFADGIFSVRNTNRSITLMSVAKAFFGKGGIPKQFGVGLDASGTWSAEPANFPNGCHICEVEIDPETGASTLDRYAAVDDCGRVINPMICEGQIVGALAQGIGQALTESLVYDQRSGQMLSGSFMDYAMPRAGDFPSIISEFHEVLCKTNPLGIKGVGEAGAIAGPAALMNAVADALDALGVETIQMPATANRVWAAISACSI